jgi:uncharacterized protein
MDNRVSQHLNLQPGEYVIEHLPQGTVPPSSADWVALVRAPEGLTIVRRLTGTEADSEGRWAAFYSGQTAHDLDLPGMLAAVVNPLGQAAIPGFVTSTYHADWSSCQPSAGTRPPGSCGERATWFTMRRPAPQARLAELVGQAVPADH